MRVTAVALLLTCLLPGQRPDRRVQAGAHLVYQWEERVDEIPIFHEIHLYQNGFIRYGRRAGGGPVQETTLPSNKTFVQSMLRQYKEARSAKILTPPCGAPQGGQLAVTLKRRTRKTDLSLPENWHRYGRLVRGLLARTVGGMPASLEADCQPLRLRVDPNRILNAPRRPPPLPKGDQERSLLLAYGAASDDTGRRKALAKLATIREGDRFFRWALLRDHADSLPARRLIRHHASVLVRGVRSRTEAAELLGLLGHRRGTEAAYHRSVLQLVVGQADAAYTSLVGFHRALNQLRAARRVARSLDRFRLSQRDVLGFRPPWGRIRRAFPRLFLFWLDLARTVWSGEPGQAPPLAQLLYRRALHYARLSAIEPSFRASTGGPQTIRGARRLVRSYYAELARGRWDRHAYWHQQDLLAVTGAIRRQPARFGTKWSKEHLLSPAETVCRMVEMRYFDVADRFIERLVEKRPATEGPLRLAQGRCLVQVERWRRARQALTKAVQLGAPGARLAVAQGLLAQGDLEGAARTLDRLKRRDAKAWVLKSQLLRLRDRPTESLAAARKALGVGPDAGAQLAAGRAWLALGKGDAARAAFRKGMTLKGPGALQARAAAAAQAIQSGSARDGLDLAWPLIQKGPLELRVTGHALIAMAAAQLGLEHLARLQIRRARHHAHTDPRALAAAARVLVRHGKGLASAQELIHLARGKRSRWSSLFAIEAFLLGRLRRIPAALAAITAALSIRPEYPPYRALERAWLKRGDVKGSVPGGADALDWRDPSRWVGSWSSFWSGSSSVAGCSSTRSASSGATWWAPCRPLVPFPSPCATRCSPWRWPTRPGCRSCPFSRRTSWVDCGSDWATGP